VCIVSAGKGQGSLFQAWDLPVSILAMGKHSLQFSVGLKRFEPDIAGLGVRKTIRRTLTWRHPGLCLWVAIGLNSCVSIC
jgi:hypothetical protein